MESREGGVLHLVITGSRVLEGRLDFTDLDADARVGWSQKDTDAPPAPSKI